MLKQKDKLIEKLDKRLSKVELFGIVTEEDATEIRNIKSALDGLKVLSEERASKEVSKEELVMRALENYAKHGEFLEVDRRSLQSNANGEFLPITIDGKIQEKLYDMCDILSKATVYNTRGTLRFIVEDDIQEADLVAEGGAINDADPTFSNVELKSYKIATSVKTTTELLNNSDIDLGEYLMNVISKRIVRAMNKYFIAGTGLDQPQGLVNGNQTVTLAGRDNVTIDDFIAIQTTMNPEYLTGASWIVSKSTFVKMAQMKDTQNRPFLTTDVIGEKIQYKLLGLPVVVDNNVPALGTVSHKAIILANIKECYAINMPKEMTVKHMTENGFTQGYEEIGAYVLVDGRIVNQDALVVGECA